MAATDRMVREAAELLWPEDELRQARAVRSAIDLAGRPVPGKFASLKTPDKISWKPSDTGHEATVRPGKATLIRAIADTAPTTGYCTITVEWENEVTGLTLLGVVNISPGSRFGAEPVAAEVAQLPAGAWLKRTISPANGATGVAVTVTIEV